MIYINKKKNIFVVSLAILLFIFTILVIPKEEEQVDSNKLSAVVINSCTDKLTVRDEKNIIYTFSVEKNNFEAGDNLIIEYTGLLDKSTENQTNKLLAIKPVSQDEEDLPNTNSGIFSQYSTLASNKLKEMTLDEKIGQILLVEYIKSSAEDDINKYKVGGFVFKKNAFEDKQADEVRKMMQSLQDKSNIPLLTATDEEGGRVVRVSSNKNLVEEAYLSPRELYTKGGFDLIATDAKEKSLVLEDLGINVNLAPVVDVSTSPSDYIYDRTLGEDTEKTKEYAKTVIEATKDTGVSHVLKHFPGYGNNEDTHEGIAIDERAKADIMSNDIPPFQSGIDSGAEAVLVNHNIVKSIDENNPASLSASIHNILRNDLDFTGVIITDDLSMKAIDSIDNAVTKAILAGNDIIITTNAQKSFDEIKKAVENNTISEQLIDNVVQRILSWKYYKGLMYEKTK